MEVKVILEDNKTNFENQIKEFIKNGYKIKNSNITTYTKRSMKPLDNINYVVSSQANKIINEQIIFYALMIKD